MRFVKLAALFTLLHATLAIGSLMFSFSEGMARFDNPALPRTYGEAVTAQAADLLFQPMMLIWRSLGVRNASAVVECAAFAANSALWGVALGATVVWLTTRSGGRAEARR